MVAAHRLHWWQRSGDNNLVVHGPRINIPCPVIINSGSPGGFGFNNGDGGRLATMEWSQKRLVLVVVGNKKERREVAIGDEEVGVRPVREA